MSVQPKLQAGREGKPASELTKLKAKWRGMEEDARAYWSSLFVSDASQAKIRAEIQTKLKINLRFDKQLNQFRAWASDQEKRDREAQAVVDDDRQLTEQFGDQWTLDQIREEVLKRSYARSLATGDFESGRKTIVQDLNVKKISLDERKLVLLEKKAAAYDRIKEIREQRDVKAPMTDADRLAIVAKIDEIMGINQK